MRPKFVILFSLISVIYGGAFAQESTGSISGVVVDATNEEPLPGATVFIDLLQKGAATDRNGEFSIVGLPAGTYSATISFMGYHVQKGTFTLKPGDAKSFVFRLESEAKSLGEVVITAKSQARQLREQAMPISVISINQLQGTVSNVQDVLAKTAGVTIRSSGGVGSASRVSVRGLEGKRIGFFIDGSPMNDNSDFIDINDIPIEMIDRIEVYKGVVPAKFGGTAIGGAVNIVIREYPPKYLDVNYTVESFNTHKTSLVFKRNIVEKGYEFGGGGFYTYSDNNYTMQSPFDDDLRIKRDHDQFNKYVAAVSFKARKWWFDLVEFELPFIHTKKQIQGIEYNVRQAHTSSNALVFANKMEKDNFLIEGLDFETSLAYAYTQFSLVDTAAHRVMWDGTLYPSVSAKGGEIGMWASNSDNRKHTFLQKLNLNYLITANHSFNFNSVFSWAYGNPADSLKGSVIGYRTDFNSRMTSWISGLSYDFRTDDDKFLNSISLKYYYYTMNTTLASIVSPSPESVNMVKHDFGVSNALRYRILSDLMLKMAIGYDVRLPSEAELLGDGFITAPAGNLEPERNASLNAGFMYDLTGKHSSNLQVEINAFYMYLQNMIRFTGGFLQSQYQNFGEMSTIGLEAELKADIMPWLYGYINATYQDLRDTRRFEQNTTIPNPTKGSRIPNIPYLMANAGLEFHSENIFRGKGHNSRLFFDGAFVEEYLYDFEQSAFQERRIPRTLSFNLGAEHSFMNGRFTISAKVNNLTNVIMLSEFNRPLPGRNFGIRLRYVIK